MSCRGLGGEELEQNERRESRRFNQLNGSVTASSELTIDENLLVDPKLLFIGNKIGEGAHGKVYEGRSVSFVLFKVVTDRFLDL